MNKKLIAIIVEAIPALSALIANISIWTPFHIGSTDVFIAVTTLIGLLGFVTFFVGRKLAGDDKVVRTLGVLDIVGAVVIVAIYALAILSFGL